MEHQAVVNNLLGLNFIDNKSFPADETEANGNILTSTFKLEENDPLCFKEVASSSLGSSSLCNERERNEETIILSSSHQYRDDADDYSVVNEKSEPEPSSGQRKQVEGKGKHSKNFRTLRYWEETEVERTARLENDKRRRLRRLAKETPEQRERRLERKRNYKKIWTQNQTADQIDERRMWRKERDRLRAQEAHKKQFESQCLATGENGLFESVATQGAVQIFAIPVPKKQPLVEQPTKSNTKRKRKPETSIETAVTCCQKTRKLPLKNEEFEWSESRVELEMKKWGLRPMVVLVKRIKIDIASSKEVVIVNSPEDSDGSVQV